MNVIEAWKTYSGLTAEQKMLLDAKLVDAAMPPDAWIAFLRDVAKFDSIGDSMRTKIGCLGAVVLVAGVIAAGAAEMWWIFLIAAVIAIPAIAAWFMLRSKDVPNVLREFVLPMLTLLREDVAPDTPLHLKLDMRKPNHADKRTATDKFDGVGGRKIKQNMYDNPWMIGDATLVDGTSLEWEVTDTIREREITKRNPRGKVKTKTKYKVKRLVDVRTSLKGKNYALAAQPIGDAGDKVGVKPGENKNTIRLRRSLVNYNLEAPLDVKDFIDLIAGAYKRVRATSEGGSQS